MAILRSNLFRKLGEGNLARYNLIILYGDPFPQIFGIKFHSCVHYTTICIVRQNP